MLHQAVATLLTALTPFLLSQTVHAEVDLELVRKASQSKDFASLQAIADANRNDTLAMYPQYFYLAGQLDQLGASSVERFLQQYDNTPLAERLRGDWLKELARRNDWSVFEREYAKVVNPDNGLRCLAAEHGLRQGKPESLAAARALWFNGNTQPTDCNPLFDTLQAGGQLSYHDIWQRVRLALSENNPALAAQLAQRVTDGNALSAGAIKQANSNPENTLNRLKLANQGERELFLYALGQLARSNPERANNWLEQRSAQFNAGEIQHGRQRIAIGAARSLNGNAGRWLQAINLAQLDDEDQEWAVRGALRSRDWRTAQRLIGEMDAALREQPVWRYWLGRAHKEQGQNEAANALFAQLQGTDFYSLLAREELGQPYVLPPSTQFDESTVQFLSLQPGIRRALALREQGWRIEAMREWNWAVRDFDDAKLLAASELARRFAWHDRSIYTAERTRELHDFQLRYPQPWLPLVLSEAGNNQLDPSWVLGIIRQESRFVADARSHAGAAGLMQLMPATARWTAKRLRIDFSPSHVTRPEVNVALGTHYMDYLQGFFSGNTILSTAGYNAGPGNARKWQTDRTLDASIYIETIPFDETRDYVKRVTANAAIYARLLGQGEARLHARLQPVAARGVPVPAGTP